MYGYVLSGGTGSVVIPDSELITPACSLAANI